MKCDVLLAALDDDAFRAVDALGLSDEVRNGYSDLKAALKKRFSPTTCKFELRFQLRRRIQQEGESFDDFADALTRQGSRALPDIESKARSEIIRDQFIEGIRDSYIQERLLQDAPSTLEEALKTARKLGAARSAQQSLRTTTAAELRVNAVSENFNLQQEVKRTVQEALRDYFPVQGSGPAEVQSIQQRATSRFFPGRGRGRGRGHGYMGNQSTQPSRTPDGRPICFKCGELGHIRIHCPKQGSSAGINCTGCGGEDM